MDGAMRQAVRMWDTSEYWKRRAAGAKRHAKYKERPDVRARRIKTLEADKRKQERNKADAEKTVRIWSTLHDDQNTTMKRKDGTPTTFHERALFVAGHTNTTSYGVYSGLDKQTMTPEDAQRQTLESAAIRIEHANRWINHLTNRLDYERAMLEESGGTLEQQKGCESGGAVRCWASPRGGWSYIQKVNKVSVSILDTWGNGGAPFKRTIEFDQLSGIMSAAEVQQKREAGLLMDDSEGIGFFILSERPAPKQAEPEAKPAIAETIDVMRETLKAGGVKVVSAPQLFPTPAHLAERMVTLADIQPGNRVLEPSAGTGALIGAMGGQMFGHNPERGELLAVEINAQLCAHLESQYPLTNVTNLDFLELQSDDIGTFDRILMNPPFANGSDIKHIRHAVTFLRPAGRLVAICANGPRQAEQLQALALESGGTWEALPDGTFSNSGTNVRTALLTVCAPPLAAEPLPDASEAQQGAMEREETPVLSLSSPEPNVEITRSGSQFLLFL